MERNNKFREFVDKIKNKWCKSLPIENFGFYKPDKILNVKDDFKTSLEKIKNIGKQLEKQRFTETNPRIVAWMEFKKEQFFLRDLLRVERFPEEPVLFDLKKIIDTNYEADFDYIRKLKYEPPQMLGKFSVEDFKWFSSLIREIIFENKWNRYFCKEIKDTISIPVWKYNPDS